MKSENITKAAYITKVVLTYDDSLQGVGPWWVDEEIIYDSDIADLRIIIPRGFPTDLTTVPKIPFVYETFANTAIKAAIIHDFLYTSKIVSRKMADAIFKEASIASKVTNWKIVAMWSALRLFGSAHYGK